MRISPKPVVGFSLVYGLSAGAEKHWENSHQTILDDFPWLQTAEIIHGHTKLILWGHSQPSRSTFIDPDNNFWVVAGSPFGAHTWKDLIELSRQYPDDWFEIPWDGRCLLLRVGADGKKWTIWNDWAGSVPVYYCNFKDGGIASCLEPVAVRTAGLTSIDFFKRGLTELFLLGHFLGTDTLYSGMKVLTPDSVSSWINGCFTGSHWLNSVNGIELASLNSHAAQLAKMRELTIEAIGSSLSGESEYPILLPLSSGMDSRLIACVSKDIGLPVQSITYGPEEWTEVYFAKQVAQVLGIPWQRVEMGVNYSADNIQRWLKWFGCSHHAHGMYQFPFLTRVAGLSGIIPNGFYGNNMAGGDHPNDCLFDTSKNLIDRFCGYGTYWSKDSIGEVLGYNPVPFYEEMNRILEQQVVLTKERNEYQRMNVLDMWNRQARSIFYQPMMYNYYGHERSPFMYRPYARFCMNLDSQLLIKRHMQIEMLDKYWPSVASVPGTFQRLKGLHRKWQGLCTIIALRLPRKLRPWMGATSVNKMELDCAQARGWDVFYPITPDMIQTNPLNLKPIIESCKSAILGNQSSLLQAVVAQPIIYRILEDAIQT